jgi:hypothetical protein
MPTEELYFANSQLEADNGGFEGARIRRDFDGEDPHQILTAVRDALLAAGWVGSGTTKATWSLVLPYGLPVTSPPDIEIEDPPTVTGGPTPVTINGKRFVFYDPFRVLPVEDPFIVWVEMSITMEGSIANLVDAIAADGIWVSTGWRFETAYPFVNWLHIDFEAVTGGLEGNGAQYGGEGDVQTSIGLIWFWAFLSPVGVAGGPFGNAPAGGGIYLRSYQSLTDYLEVWLGIPESGSPAATLRFTASVEGGAHPAYQLAAAADREYRILANQFQFFVWDLAGGSEHVFAVYPRMATFRGTAYAAVVGRGFRTLLQWPHAYAAANSGLVRSRGGGDGATPAARQPGLCCFKNPGFPYASVDGKAIAQTAYLGCMPNDAVDSYEGQSRIVGILWDAWIIQGLFTLGDERLIDGIPFECIGQQNGGSLAAHASIWVAY